MQIKVSARHGHLSDDHQAQIREKDPYCSTTSTAITMIEVTVDSVATDPRRSRSSSRRNTSTTSSPRQPRGSVRGRGPGDGQDRAAGPQVQGKDPGPSPHTAHGGARVIDLVAPTRGTAHCEGPMTDFIVRESRSRHLAGSPRKGPIREMVETSLRGRLLQGGEPEDIVRPRSCAASSWARRASAAAWPSRTPGTSVSCPGCRHPGLSKAGVAFDSLDGEPVTSWCSAHLPQDRPGDHLRALETSSASAEGRRLRQAAACTTRDQHVEADRGHRRTAEDRHG